MNFMRSNNRQFFSISTFPKSAERVASPIPSVRPIERPTEQPSRPREFAVSPKICQKRLPLEVPKPKSALAKTRQKIKNDLIYYSARSLMFLIAHTPYRLVSWAGQWFGLGIYKLSAGERRKTLQNLRVAYPRMEEKDLRALARSTWKNIGRNLFETVHWTGWQRQEILAEVARVQGLEHMKKALDRGQGAFVVTAHLGNWELLGSYLGSRFEKLVALAKPLYDPRFDKLITDFRTQKLGATSIIKRGAALRGILNALKNNSFIEALCDQDTGNDGVFVPFFGKAAWTQSGVARIAAKTGAALVPAFMVRGADGRYEIHIEPEIEIAREADGEADIVETVHRFTAVIERYVRAYPGQWVWMHRRWKTRPLKDE